MSGPEPQVAGTEIADSILDLIGNTPMVKLPRLSESQGLVATLAVKLETTNPGGSVKDRPAVAMIDAAERMRGASSPSRKDRSRSRSTASSRRWGVRRGADG